VTLRADLEWTREAEERRSEEDRPFLSWSDFETARTSSSRMPIFTVSILLVCTMFFVVSIGLFVWKLARSSTGL
jgi:hypothetical protein